MEKRHSMVVEQDKRGMGDKMKNQGVHAYDDIINLPHHQSTKHAHMPVADRAAQFSPFAALSGHDAAIKETARLTDRRIDLDEYGKAAVDEKLRLLREHIEEHPTVNITYFVPDSRKAGGAYEQRCGEVKRIDEYGRGVIFADGTVIFIEDILDMESESFRGYAFVAEEI